MGKSIKKNCFCGNTCAKSEKKDKQLHNRKFRKSCKQILDTTIDDTLLKDKKVIANVYDMGKDGKQYFGDIDDLEYKDKLRRK